ncbi:Lrp/AsnC family transcriptional regulator [Candidatus Woesearchaeota archaeon]|nr:Lrp/AsnC family transcriptional regulator [Candidatus Woesearchaeota archaeon]
MDALDRKILLELMKNSRTPVTALAKRLRASREVVNYRISRLVKEGIILNFVTEIDLEKLGFIGAAVFISIKSAKNEEFKAFLKERGFVSWVAELSGIWNYGMSIYGRDNTELDKRFSAIYSRFKEHITGHRFTLHKKNQYFYEKYMGYMEPGISTAKGGNKPDKFIIGRKDKIILREMAKNSRIGAVELAAKAEISAPAASQRIRKMERLGIISKYSVFVDISKLSLYQYSVFVSNKKAEESERLVSYLSQHPGVSFIAEYIGDPFVEFGVAVDDPYKLRAVLQKIEDAFPNNKIIEISLFQKEFASIGPPECVFSIA